MTAQEVLAELKSLGNENIKRIFMNHGVKEPLFGVKIEDLKKIQKKIRKDHQLSLDLYKTGNADAMYLAGLIADEKKITASDLKSWAIHSSAMLSEYTVPWVAAESNHGYQLAMEWINSSNETLQVVGWSTLSSIVAIVPDDKLDIKELKTLLRRVQDKISSVGNRVTSAMNGFVISTGTYVKDLTDLALKTGNTIGKVSIDMNGTACKIPYSADYIQKVIDRGTIGKKKKMARC
jgi:3-methyladenine DNA glycosylase AlkD